MSSSVSGVCLLQAKEVSQAAMLAQSASAAAAAQDAGQLLYDIEWQVSQARTVQPHFASPCSMRRRLQHELIWSASSPAAVQQRASVMRASSMGPAAAASQAAARQAQVLQQIMGAPGEPRCPMCMQMSTAGRSPQASCGEQQGVACSRPGGSARLVTRGAQHASSTLGGGQPGQAMEAAAIGMAGAAMLRVAAAESPSWRWGSIDLGSFSAAEQAAVALPSGAPLPDAQSSSLQVCHCSFLTHAHLEWAPHALSIL